MQALGKGQTPISTRLILASDQVIADQLGSGQISSTHVPCCAGAQLAKMTPFRSFVVTLMTALSLTVMSLLKFKGGTITYVTVSASASEVPCIMTQQRANALLRVLKSWQMAVQCLTLCPVSA